MEINKINQNFDKVLNNIKEEKIDFDPFSFMRKTTAEINEENRRSSASIRKIFGRERIMTEIPLNITLPPLRSINEFKHMLKLEPVEFNEHETRFEKDSIEDKENSALKGERKRKRRAEKPTANKRVKYEHTEEKCTICDYKNIARMVMTRHIKLHSNPDVIKCEKVGCHALCSSKRTIQLHKKRCH